MAADSSELPCENRGPTLRPSGVSESRQRRQTILHHGFRGIQLPGFPVARHVCVDAAQYSALLDAPNPTLRPEKCYYR